MLFQDFRPDFFGKEGSLHGLPVDLKEVRFREAVQAGAELVFVNQIDSKEIGVVGVDRHGNSRPVQVGQGVFFQRGDRAGQPVGSGAYLEHHIQPADAPQGLLLPPNSNSVADPGWVEQIESPFYRGGTGVFTAVDGNAQTGPTGLPGLSGICQP